MTPDDSLKLFIGIISAVGALIGTWAGSKFTKVNEHKKWLRDQKLEVYRECYQASQRWIDSVEAIYKGHVAHEDYAKRMAYFDPRNPAEGVAPPPKKDIEAWGAIVDKIAGDMALLRQQFTEYGLLPVEMVASNYVRAGVRDVEAALPFPSFGDPENTFEKGAERFRAAQQEMINRFRDDLNIQDTDLVPLLIRVIRREVRVAIRKKRMKNRLKQSRAEGSE